MNFMTILKSFEEFLYEIMTWLVFYPRTLWLSLRHPMRMTDYADVELGDSEDRQYTDTLSPPLFLVVTIIISHGLELAIAGQNAVVRSNRGLSSLIDSDTNLIVYRAIAFSIFPLMMAVRLLRRKKIKLDRETLRPPFYSQCYVTAPIALVFGLVTLLPIWKQAWALEIGIAVFAVVLLWYLALQANWFAKHVGSTLPRSALTALNGYLQALVILLAGALLFV